MSMSEQNDASLDKNSAIKDQNEDSDLVSARKPESSGESAWTTAQADTLGVSSDVNASEANSRLMEQQQTNGEKEEQVHSQQGRDESSSSETNQASRQMTDDESLQPMVSRTKTLHHNGATKDAKSRWSMSGSNKRPLSDVDSSGKLSNLMRVNFYMWAISVCQFYMSGSGSMLWLIASFNVNQHKALMGMLSI